MLQSVMFHVKRRSETVSSLHESTMCPHAHLASGSLRSASWAVSPANSVFHVKHLWHPPGSDASRDLPCARVLSTRSWRCNRQAFLGP